MIQAIVGATAGALLYGLWSATLAAVAWSVSGLMAMAALVSPLGAYAFVGKLFGLVGRTIGTVLTFLLLVPIYWLFFVPFGTLLRRGRRDRLQRRLDRATSTYWQSRGGGRPAPQSYEQQF